MCCDVKGLHQEKGTHLFNLVATTIETHQQGKLFLAASNTASFIAREDNLGLYGRCDHDLTYGDGTGQDGAECRHGTTVLSPFEHLPFSLSFTPLYFTFISLVSCP